MGAEGVEREEGVMEEGRAEEEAASAAVVVELLSPFIVSPTGTPIATAIRARTRRHHNTRLFLFFLPPSFSHPCAPFSPNFSPAPALRVLYSYVSPIVNLCLLSPLTLPPSYLSPPLHVSIDPPALPPRKCEDVYAMFVAAYASAESERGAAKSSVGTGTGRDG